MRVDFVVFFLFTTSADGEESLLSGLPRLAAHRLNWFACVKMGRGRGGLGRASANKSRGLFRPDESDPSPAGLSRLSRWRCGAGACIWPGACRNGDRALSTPAESAGPRRSHPSRASPPAHVMAERRRASWAAAKKRFVSFQSRRDGGAVPGLCRMPLSGAKGEAFHPPGPVPARARWPADDRRSLPAARRRSHPIHGLRAFPVSFLLIPIAAPLPGRWPPCGVFPGSLAGGGVPRHPGPGRGVAGRRGRATPACSIEDGPGIN